VVEEKSVAVTNANVVIGTMCLYIEFSGLWEQQEGIRRESHGLAN